MKKLITLLLLAVFSLSAQAVTVTDYDFIIGNYYYKITSDLKREVELVTNWEVCYFFTGDVVVPDSVQHNNVWYKVTSIGDLVFSGADLTSLSLPSGIRSIGEECFSYSRIRGGLVLPDSLRVIKKNAFCANSGIESIHIPALVGPLETRSISPMLDLQTITVDSANQYYSSYNGVLYNKDTTVLISCPAGKTGVFVIPDGVVCIAEASMEVCELSSIVIPNTVRTIKTMAFSECEQLTSMHIPASVTHIEGGIFRGNKRLTDITIDSLNTNYKVIDNVLYSMDMDTLLSYHLASDSVRVLDGVKVIGMDAFSLINRLSIVVLPEGIETIQSGAFEWSGIRKINLPNTLKFIGNGAFTGSSLSNIVIPNSVVHLGEQVFEGVESLVTVVMSDSVKVIPYGAFNYCQSLRSYTGGASVERINSRAFSNCESFAKNLVFPSTLKVIEVGAFFDTDIKTVEFTGIIDSIGRQNFENLNTLVLVNPTPPYTYNTKVANSIFKTIIPCGATEAYMADPNWSSYSYTEDCDGVEENPMVAVKVTAGYRSIEVLNAEAYPVAIYDAMGRCHISEGATGQNIRHYSLPTAGVYVVRVNDRGYKVVVR